MEVVNKHSMNKRRNEQQRELRGTRTSVLVSPVHHCGPATQSQRRRTNQPEGIRLPFSLGALFQVSFLRCPFFFLPLNVGSGFQKSCTSENVPEETTAAPERPSQPSRGAGRVQGSGLPGAAPLLTSPPAQLLRTVRRRPG